jgi:hypothetical protein
VFIETTLSMIKETSLEVLQIKETTALGVLQVGTQTSETILWLLRAHASAFGHGKIFL